MVKPFIIKNIFTPEQIKSAQDFIEIVKRSPSTEFDVKEFNRKMIHNHLFFQPLHQELFENLVMQTSDGVQKLKDFAKPSYNFLSMYFEGLGICPKHTDRPQCKLTVDVCFGQNQPWPFYAEVDGVTHEYILEVGDALVLSGTDHPHWRNKIQSRNFCDLVFFHFVAKDFEGGLN